jgi:chemotaxis protein MotA
VIGILVALAALLLGTLIEGGSPAAYANPSAILIIFGGTFGATIASFSMAQFKTFPKLFALAIKTRKGHAAEMRDRLVAFAERARREGLLALESDVDQVEDPFLRKGLQMVIDGLEPEVVEEILELDTEAMQRRHASGVAMFTAMGGYAPTMGVIGTVMGLVNVLGNLDDPGELGGSIAVAFIATLIGVGSANIVWLPVANALKVNSGQEVAERRMAITGILAIQAGDNPRIVAQKLDAFGVRATPAAAAAEPAVDDVPAAGQPVAASA